MQKSSRERKVLISSDLIMSLKLKILSVVKKTDKICGGHVR